MNINLHIERLVLDGVSLARGHEPLLRAAIEAELSRLLATNGLPSSLLSGGAVPRLQTGEIQLANEHGAQHLGRQIAGALHGELSQ
ncbi:MAG: hypothetical protein ACJ74W_23030 [Pyrinomonadaceae bacterium]